ncbi:MAG: hypothetical protein J0M12_12925 [Deltaproteobacteria bacterium]|nr:hypothetical protein [Deltaproteobacteria bacterium]
MHNLSESDANRFLTKLHDLEIDANKEKQADGSWLVSVPKDDAMRAIRSLDSARLFRPSRVESQERSSIIATREDQRLRSERMLAENLEVTLSSISGVLEAHVHLNLPPTDPLFGSRLHSAPGSASVLVVATPELKAAKEEILSLIAGASGVEPKGISIIISRAESDASAHALSPVPGNIAPRPTHRLFDDLPLIPFATCLLLISTGLAHFLWRSRRKAQGAT